MKRASVRGRGGRKVGMVGLGAPILLVSLSSSSLYRLLEFFQDFHVQDFHFQDFMFRTFMFCLPSKAWALRSTKV